MEYVHIGVKIIIKTWCVYEIDLVLYSGPARVDTTRDFILAVLTSNR